MRKRLGRKFFERKTLMVARDLLGKVLVRKIGNRLVSALITETEAYCGPEDLASHASKGKTPRTTVMFGPAGYSYIYLIYGMYHCLNIVTDKDGYPAAVLIRGARIVSSNEYPVLRKQQKTKRSLALNTKFLIPNTGLLDGPGKLCRELKIDKTLNSEDTIISKKLWVEDHGVIIRKSEIKATSRIGVDYAKEYKDKPWRFVLESKQ